MLTPNEEQKKVVAEAIDEGIKMLGERAHQNEIHCGCAVALGAFLVGYFAQLLAQREAKAAQESATRVWETVEAILEGHEVEKEIKVARNAARVYTGEKEV